ncbi:MAG: hypothetical protein RR659_03790 [Bacilli bacterium]
MQKELDNVRADLIKILCRNDFHFDYCKSRNLTEVDLQNMDLDILFEHLTHKTNYDHTYNAYYFYQLQRRNEFKHYLNYNPKDRCLPEDRKNLLYLLDYLNSNKADINAYLNKQQINFSIDDLNNLKLQILDELKVSKNFVMNPHLITPAFEILLEQFNTLQLSLIGRKIDCLEKIKSNAILMINDIKRYFNSLNNDELISIYQSLDDYLQNPYSSVGYYCIKNDLNKTINQRKI